MYSIYKGHLSFNVLAINVVCKEEFWLDSEKLFIIIQLGGHIFKNLIEEIMFQKASIWKNQFDYKRSK